MTQSSTHQNILIPYIYLYIILYILCCARAAFQRITKLYGFPYVLLKHICRGALARKYTKHITSLVSSLSLYIVCTREYWLGLYTGGPYQSSTRSRQMCAVYNIYLCALMIVTHAKYSSFYNAFFFLDFPLKWKALSKGGFKVGQSTHTQTLIRRTERGSSLLSII